jgi:hypothetical protein
MEEDRVVSGTIAETTRDLTERRFVQKQFWLYVCVLSCALVGSVARPVAQGRPPGEEFIGVWSGTWEGGGGSGGFEITLEKAKDDPLTGKVSVTGDPTYKAAFKTLSFEGKTMKAKYDFPPSEADAEVALSATFDGTSAKGTWSLRAKANDAEVASGTWSVTKNK